MNFKDYCENVLSEEIKKDPRLKLISKIREYMAESGKYNDSAMEKWYNKLYHMDIEKLKQLCQNPMKFNLKIRPINIGSIQ